MTRPFSILMRAAQPAAAIALLASAALGQATPAPPPSPSAPRAPHAAPSLVVLVTIDQMRADYLTRFASQYTGGLARLSRGGAWFTDAHHDHAITETAPGHATLLSGRFPRSTGIMMNRYGVEDPSMPLVAGGVGSGASPARFQGTTLVDWIRATEPQSRALSVSAKDRGAILPIGKSQSDVYWYSSDGRFVTSRYYRTDLPAWVSDFNDRHLPQQYASREWSLLLADSAYHERDSVPQEAFGRGFLFPHRMPDDPIDAASVLRATPFMDEVTLALALHGVQAMALGNGPQTDVLSVSLSATDYIGHAYGPDSREIHDQLLRVDRSLGAFVDSLYKLRDSSHVTIVLTGDHGEGSMPELAPAGTEPPPVHASIAPVLPALRASLRAAKVDTMAIDVDVQIILADRAAFRAAGVNADSTLAAFAAVLRTLPGVARVDRFASLVADSASDPIARRWAHQFPTSAPVEYVVTLTPYSIWGNIPATHGSPRDYDSHVPIVFYGAGVKPGRVSRFVRTVDLAPTLAAIAGVRPTERLDGVVLTDAIAH